MKRITIIGLAVFLMLIPLLGLTCDCDNDNDNGTESPVADFSASAISGTIPLEVEFTNQSTGDITEWEWAFGDGSNSTEKDPKHTYTTADEFIVILVVTDADGETDSKEVTITATAADTATYTLDTSVSPADSGSVSPSSGDYEEGSEVILTAEPAEGYEFDSWGGDASGSSATVTITMDSDMGIVANFKEAEPEPDQEPDVTIEGQVVFDQDGITIRVESLDFDSSILGPELKLLVENQSDRDITVEVQHLAINGSMVDGNLNCSVQSKDSEFCGIIIPADILEKNGIETIKDIEFQFHIYDTDSGDTIVDSETIEIQTSADDSFVQVYDDSGEIVLDENDIKVVVQGLAAGDCTWGARVLVYIENNTDQDFRISVEDVTVNGFEIEPVFYSDILAGKKAFDSINFLESDLDDNDINIVTTIELSFHVVSLDTEVLILDSDPVTITIE